MAVLNVRVDDRILDQLRKMADAEGVTLSEFVRVLLTEATVPVWSDDRVKPGDQPAPESMSIIDRQVLSLLHRILGRVLPEDANDVDGDTEYQLMRARILEEGFVGEYWYETAGFRTELSARDCSRVSDVLQMFRILTFSIDNLAKEGTPIDQGLAERLEFRGFDHGEALEGQMAAYVDFQMRDGDRWTELKPQIARHDDGDSHMPVLDMYMRMLAEYRRITDSRDRGFGRSSYVLTADEIEALAQAQVHPSSRLNHQD